MNIVTKFMTTVTDLVQSGAAENSAKIANAISPIFGAAVMLYIVYIAYEIMYSQKDVIMQDVSKTIASLCLVGAFTFSSPYYVQYVIPFVMGAGSDLSNAVSGNSNVASSVDGLWNSLSTTLNNYLNTTLPSLGMTDIGGVITTYLIWGIGFIGGVVLVFYTTIFLVVSTFMVGLLLSVGIIFICFSFFPTTRSMFTAWVGSCLNYILLNVFYTISFGFTLKLINQFTLSRSNPPSLMSAIYLLLVIVISVFLIEQIGSLCSTLTGGVGINGLTSSSNKAVGALGKVSGMRALGNAGGGLAKKMLSRGAGKIAGRVASAAKSIGKNIVGG